MTKSTQQNSSQVRVAVRVRPLASKERNCKTVVDVIPPASMSLASRNFTFDLVFNAHVSQLEIYEVVSPDLLSSFLEGYNSTVMAYGQTGSGKTFTMGSEVHHTDGDVGLIPRFMHSIFNELKKKREINLSADGSEGLVDFLVKASFLEVYGEDVHDLLDYNRKVLPLREDADGGVIVAGLTNHIISSAEEALKILNQGTVNRTTASTLMNLTSSRSHAVFTIYLTQILRKDSIDITTSSKFTLVDLAGSERMKKTGAVGERALEGIKINEGLLALGNVINALADDDRNSKEKKVYVPYRQSKLTRLLQDALGGNSKTLFIACVSPAETNVSETMSTLHYANRARNIKNAPIKNLDPISLEVQRLQCLNLIYCKELISNKFGTQDLDNSEVKSYLQELHEAALINIGPPQSLSLPLMTQELRTSSSDGISATSSFGNSSNVLATPSRLNTGQAENIFDESILEEVNPEEELAILDQLLELQYQDQEFCQSHKERQGEIKQVQGELDEQEALLLQLRESLKVYHNIKAKYQMLMAEVQQLESEKSLLAEQLEKASTDPTKGCSLAIKKKLEKVEASLVRARNETRKHQQKCREAEQQAQKCKALERKILHLKQEKIAMIKKQTEATNRYRELTEQKTRELLVMKKKERSAGIQLNKLHAQIQSHKNDMAKRKVYTKKLTEKLKETEVHLMKLLSIRSRELQNRQFSPGRRMSTRTPHLKDGFAEDSPELESIRLVLNRVVLDRVEFNLAKSDYEALMSEYSQLVSRVVAELKILNKNNQGNEESKEQEHIVEDLQLKLEIVTTELRDLKSKLENSTDSNGDLRNEERILQTIGSLNATNLRTLLWDYVIKLADSDLHREKLSKESIRKDSIIESFESEVEALSQKVTILSNDLTERRLVSSGNLDPVEKIRTLEKQLEETLQKLDRSNLIVREKEKLLTSLKRNHAAIQLELLEVKERLTFLETSESQKTNKQEVEKILEILQALWNEIGLPIDLRDKARKVVKSSFEDTCSRQIDEARKLKEHTEDEIKQLNHKKFQMLLALGKSDNEVDMQDDQVHHSLLDKRNRLQREIDTLEPEFNGAISRRNEMKMSLISLMKDMDMKVEDLNPNLKTLLTFNYFGDSNQTESMYTVEDISWEKGFASAFLVEADLDRLEKELTSLRFDMSKRIATNMESLQEIRMLSKEMHLSREDITMLLDTSAANPLPTWWQNRASDQVIESIVEDGIVEVSLKFTQHLIHISNVIQNTSKERKKLSSALKNVIDRAQRTLLSTVGEEVDASEAYANFHVALFNLPTLSKEHIQTCISEMNALTIGIETMIQSEIEALTVVWEALQVTTKERGEFWQDIEDSTKAGNEINPFNEESTYAYEEKWIISARDSAATAYSTLISRLNRLERIHNQVEKLRSQQDAKSRIISLDSEIRILSSRLADFEDKKCSKERLITKKPGTSSLLREERFRKQMQGKFTSKLHELKLAVMSWRANDGVGFDKNILSDEVQMLLDNPDKMDLLVKKRTDFMHLRTVQPKTAAGKRNLHQSMPFASPAIKKPRGINASPYFMSSESLEVEESKELATDVKSSSLDSISIDQVSTSDNRKRLKNISNTKLAIKTPCKDRSERKRPRSPVTTSQVKSPDRHHPKRVSIMPFSNILGDSSPNVSLN
jgi:kinesin family member 4